MASHFWTSPVFVVPVLWALFLSGILWGSQALSRQGHSHHDEADH